MSFEYSYPTEWYPTNYNCRECNGYVWFSEEKRSHFVYICKGCDGMWEWSKKPGQIRYAHWKWVGIAFHDNSYSYEKHMNMEDPKL